jgi:hypothetical protein
MALDVMKECNDQIYNIYKMITKHLNDNDAFRNLLDFQNGETIRTLWRTHKKAVQSLAEFNLSESLKEL